MGRKETDVQANITFSQENIETLQAYCKENHLSRTVAVNRAVELLVLDSLQSKAPDLGAYIDDFEDRLHGLASLFRLAIERSISADDRARTEVQAQLEGMATLSKATEKLEAENTEMRKLLSKQEAIIEDQKQVIKKLNSNIETLTASVKENETLKKRYLDLAQEKEELVSKHNEEISKLQNELFAKIIEVVKAAGTK